MITNIDSMYAKMDRLVDIMLILAQKEKDTETNVEPKRVAAQFGCRCLTSLE